MLQLDKDLRFMAVNDLILELRKSDFRVGPDMERRMAAAILKLIEDPVGEVRNQALQWFAAIAVAVPARRLRCGAE